jgi:hypothetical protein
MNRVAAGLLNFCVIADWLIDDNKAMLKSLHGFVAAENAFLQDADKLTVLK